MAEDTIARLTKMAAQASDPADREWAKAKLASVGGGATEPPPVAAAQAAQPTVGGEKPGFLDSLRGIGDRFESGVKSLDRGIYRGVAALGDSINNGFAFGLPARIMEATGAYPDRATLDELHSEHPNLSLLGRAAGQSTSAYLGPEAMIGGSAQGLMGAAQGAVPFLANNMAGRILAQGGAGALAGGGSEAARAAVQGQPVLPAAANGLMFGGLGGMALAGAGEAAGGMANAVRNSKGGQSRKLIEDSGGEVGPTSSGKGGPFEAELKGLPANDTGIGRASKSSAERILSGLESEHMTKTVKPAAVEKEAIANSPAGDTKVDATKLYSDLVRLHKSMRLSPSEKGVVNGVLNDMDNLIERRGSVEMTQTELNDWKGMLNGLSDPGNNAPTVAEAKLAGVAHTAKEMVDQGPYRDINAITHEGILKHNRQRSMIDMEDRPHGRENVNGVPEAEANKLANALARQDQNTVTAGLRNGDRYKQFAEENPQYARDINLPDILRAKSDLGLHAGNKGHGGLINRLPAASGAMATAGLAMATHGSAISALPIAAQFAAQNFPAITGRFAYGPAMGAEAALAPMRLTPGGPLQAPIMGKAPGLLPAGIQSLIEAYRQAMERSKEGNQ